MQITLNLRALLPTELVSDSGASLRMSRVVQMQMKRRGVETRLVIPGEAVAVCRSDPALLRALSRGYQWFGELASGRAASTRQIAAREGLSHSYVRHVVPLGLLAPKVMEAICAGQQSVTISAERLKDHARLPIEWDAQQRLLAGLNAIRISGKVVGHAVPKPLRDKPAVSKYYKTLCKSNPLVPPFLRDRTGSGGPASSVLPMLNHASGAILLSY